jgi:Big-like domain-containing protein/parallel beta helix pectate lyase-like protein
MKSLAILVIMLLTVLVACKPIQNEGQEDWATVDLSIDHPQRSINYQAADSGDISTAMIIAVPESIDSVSRTTYILDLYARGLLDLSSSSVELSLPLNVPIRIAEVVFTDILSLSQIVSNQPTATTNGISEPITITASDDTVSILIPLATLHSIAIVPSVEEVEKGNTIQLTAVGTYSDDSTTDISKAVIWSSSDESIASVSSIAGSEGLITGVDFGSATISVTEPFFSISSSDSNNDREQTVVVPTGLVVSPHYSNSGSNWNDCVKNDGADLYSATGTACNPGADSSCLHGGVIRSIEVLGKSTCAGLTFADSLDLFNWICDGSTNPVRIISSEFKKGKGLPDLIDFPASQWKPINFTVWDSGVPYNSSGLMTWWSNPVVLNNDGSDGSDMNEGEVHIITANPQSVYTIGADKVALVIQPGVTMTGSAATNETLITANSRSFVWIEGLLDAAGDDTGISFSTTTFSVLDDVTVSNANLNGIDLLSASDGNLLRNITANSNGAIGIKLTGSSNNELRGITTNNNTNIGIYLVTSSNKNRLSDISAPNNNDSSFSAIDCVDNTLSVTTHSGGAGFGTRLVGGASTHNLLFNITSHSASHGIDLVSSSYNTVLNIAPSTNINKGVNITASTNNYFTGELRVGGGQSVNCNDDPPDGDGGLSHVSCANNSGSDAVLTTSTDLTSSFNATDWELQVADTQIRDILSLPTGNDTVTHTWSDAGTTTILRNAVEIQDDAIGNDNFLCETGETCLFTPNIGRYQGHGNLINAGTIGAGGTLENIILLEYETNGY